MKKKLKYILPLLLFLACVENKEDSVFPEPLFSQPKIIKLNKSGGYIVNPVSGEAIQPVILASGDTLITGKPIHVRGKVINLDNYRKRQGSKKLINSQLTVKDAHSNKHKIPRNLTVIPVNQDSLTSVLFSEISKTDSTHYLVNSTYDTVKTGVPIPLIGKKVVIRQPKIKKALSPRFKDATNTDLRYLDVNQGMLSSYILSMEVDKNGNIWFGTYGGGVSCYDGNSFVHYAEKEGLSNSKVRSILEDKNGNIWFGTYSGGLIRYDGESFLHYTEKGGLSNNTIYSILEDRDGNLWFGTGEGVSCYDGCSIMHYTEKEGLSNNKVLSILEDKNGYLWFGTDGGGVCRYDDKRFVHYTEKEGLSNNTVYAILEDKSGILWFGTEGGGVCRYDGERFVHYAEKEGLSNNIVYSMLEDRSGHLWFGTYGGGVNCFDGENFVHYTEKEGLSNNNVVSIQEDQSGNIWFGTFGGGVSRHYVESFVYYTEKEGLSDNIVLSMLEDKRGNIWFGTNGGGVCCYDEETFVHYTEKEGLSNNIVISILEDKDGNIWFGTYGGGVSCYDGESFVEYTKKGGLSSNIIYSILEDKKGNIWFGTKGGGLVCYDGKSFINYTEKEGLNNNIIYSILEDKSGNLWFSTEGAGVGCYDGENFIYYTEKEGLSSNIVYSILEDKSGNIWFGTDGGGVSCYDGKNFITYTEKEGLSNNIISSMRQDQNGNLWLGSELGLNELVWGTKNTSEFLSNGEKIKRDTLIIQQYLKNDGLKGLDFYNSVLFDSKNRAWWGTGKNLTMLDLNTHIIDQELPSIFLKQIDINEQFNDYRNLPDSLRNEIRFSEVQRFGNYPLNLELAYNKNHLTFNFVAIDWNAPHKIKYSYRLMGFESKWSKPSIEAKANYINLTYGTFTFEVKAIGGSQKWSDSFKYTFTITPPWWHTWWARILYVLSILLLIFVFFKWYTNQLKARQKELEMVVEKATKDLKHKNIELEKQKMQVEKANIEITDSIKYAERIQRSFLATEELLDENLDEYFVYFNPKEAVSGDFYWAGKLSNGNFAMVNADSTGHGVPGAIMSILNVSSIEKAIEKGATCPAEIFNQTRKTIINRLNKNGSEDGGRDGMDASLISFNSDKTKIAYVAAKNPIWIIRAGKLIEIKPEEMTVGKDDNDHVPFKGGECSIQKGDKIYTMTDGFQDQFGGPKGNKFMVKRMRKYILSISNLPMVEQHQKIAQTFSKWKGNMLQIDDVCIIGVKI